MAPPKVNENSSMDVAKIFTTLDNAGCSLKDKQLAYSSLTRYLTEEDGLSNPYVQERSDQLLKFLLQDSLIQNNEIIRSLLKILQYYIKEDNSRDVMKDSTVFQILLRTLKEEHSDAVNNDILNCLALAFQKLQPSVFTADISVLLERLEDMYARKKAHSYQFIERLVDAVFRLEEQLGQKFTTDAPCLVLLVIHGLTHPLQDTRIKSLEIFTKYKSQLTGNVEFAENLMKIVSAQHFSKNHKALLSKDSKHATKVWSMLLDYFGKSDSQINIMLQIIEPALQIIEPLFKDQPEARKFAFRAWRSLVDDLALDPELLFDAQSEDVFAFWEEN